MVTNKVRYQLLPAKLHRHRCQGKNLPRKIGLIFPLKKVEKNEPWKGHCLKMCLLHKELNRHKIGIVGNDKSLHNFKLIMTLP